MFMCPGCNLEFSDGVKCNQCFACYCFTCANITEKNYRKLGAARQSALLCANCKCSQPQMMPDPISKPTSGSSSNATLDLVLHELRDGIAGINVRLEQIPVLVLEVKDMKDKLHHFENSLLEVKNEVDANKSRTCELESRLTSLESTCTSKITYPQLECKLSQLASDMSSRDQRERYNNIEIKGVPLKKNENLISLVRLLGDTIGQAVTSADINFVMRARSFTNNKPIIVGFVGRYTKENFVAAAKTKKNLTAADVGFLGVTSRIFINDHLTRENKQLLTITKKLASEKNYKYTWVQNCKILVRKSDTSPIIQILCADDHEKIK